MDSNIIGRLDIAGGGLQPGASSFASRDAPFFAMRYKMPCPTLVFLASSLESDVDSGSNSCHAPFLHLLSQSRKGYQSLKPINVGTVCVFVCMCEVMWME